MRLRFLMPGLAGMLVAAPLAAQDVEPDVEMWRLDCGTIELSDAAPFSDAHLYDGEERVLTDSCYLIRNGDRYLLWDTGLPAALKGTSATQWVFTLSLEETIAEQLAEIDLAPEDITFVGLSHYHDDHIGQAAGFPGATLVMNARDIAAIRERPIDSAAQQLAPWISGGGEIAEFSGDHDVFGDGTVTVVATPGHTPGHSALLVRLPEAGDLLLTGDLYHFEEQIANRGVPVFNTNRADTLASFERFNAMAEALEATVIIQHDPRYVDRLPAFPEAAR